MIQATNEHFYADNIDSLKNNIKPFKFFQCDTKQLLSKNVYLPYIPSSVAFNDFIILSNDCFRNWRPQTINNPNFLNNALVLRRISIAFFDHIKLLNTQIIELQSQIEIKNYQIHDFESKLKQRHTIYIVCILINVYFLVSMYYIYVLFIFYCLCVALCS